MKKSLLVLSALLINNLSAATLSTDKPSYTTTDTVKINFKEMDNHHKDWIGIYPADSSTAWKNVVKWAWTQNKSNGTVTFKNLPAGNYEVRGFYNNSYNAEASKTFKVGGHAVKAELSPTKAVFQASEDVLINFKNINGASNDWLAIYRRNGTSYTWENVVKWKFNKGGVKAGQANFDKLPAGPYRAVVYYNNTFQEEASCDFSVARDIIKGNKVTLSEGADPVGVYIGDSVSIDYGYENNKHIPKKDWVAIYKKGDSTAFKNVIRWSWVVDLTRNGPDSGASRAFMGLSKNLKNGEYEVRFFRNNSYKVDAIYPFTVAK